MPRVTDENRRWWTLVGTCLGLFLLMLDSTIVTLALPSIQHDLDASRAGLQWVLNGYLLVVAVLVVTFGRLGDIFGRRRMFLAGMSLFVAGSVVSAAAPSIEVLIAGRALQGAGGAAMVTLSLAIVNAAFAPADRPRALGIWAAVSSIALAVGPLLGGALIDSLSWRWIFWINLPIGVAGYLITRSAAAETRDEGAGRGLDWPGLATLSLGLGGVVLALVEGRGWGWTSATTLGTLGAGLAMLVAFWLVEHRVEAPIVDFALFRNGPYFGASAAGFAILGCYWGTMFFQPQYLQNILGYSAAAAGLPILPITAPMIAISPLAGRLMATLGARLLMTLGMLCLLGGMILLTRITGTSGYGALLPGYLLLGISLGLVYAPMSTAAMAAMPAAKAGIAAGVLAMNRMMAGTLGLAAMGALFQHLEQDRLAELLPQRAGGLTPGEQGELDGLLAGSSSAQQALEGLPPSIVGAIMRVARDTYSYALANATWILVGMAALGAVLTWLFVRDTPGVREVPEPASAEHHPHYPLHIGPWRAGAPRAPDAPARPD